MWLYQFFAWIIMPHRRHTKSRNIFIQEAVNLGHKEFCCWLNSLMPYRNLEHYINIIDRHIKKIPVLVLMGDEDHMFLTNTVQTALRIKGVCICIFKECGHVCNIEKAKDFNEIVLHFLKNRTINHKSEIFTHTPHQHTLLVS
jgi:pimeloyl-ACP methyl ester carboxylesterase